ncbi:MAG: GFA family protein [Gammaproteobacteria bacterium]|nr:GFA family protein [Gammaproteobacteria bacterium]
MANCHCSMCRKHHGAMFSTFVSAPDTGFRWVSGQDNIETYPSSENGRRPFCRTCGSVTPMLLPAMNLVLIPAGNLQDDPGLKPQMHMFAGSRAPWYPITDGLPQHPGYPPQFGGGMGIDRPHFPQIPGVTHGSCLCGAVAWELAGKPERMQNCHCSRCRRARSAAHATNAFYLREQLTWLQGESEVKRYSLPGAKHFGQDFCGRCGSSVPRVVSSGRAVVPCGSLDTDPGARPLGNIFATSRASWFEITDGLPQWETYPARA